MSMKNIILPEFQDYLRSKSLVNAKYIPYFALWASKFLAFSENDANLSHDLQVQKFFNYLKTQKNIADWQVRQADNAVILYVNQFLDRNESSSPSCSHETKHLDASSEIIEQMREALRIKHYAYDTEIVYLDWARKFYHYIRNIKQKDLKSRLGSADVRDYLSHLAIKRKVASSTQN
jgi:hypothetical protein